MNVQNCKYMDVHSSQRTRVADKAKSVKCVTGMQSEPIVFCLNVTSMFIVRMQMKSVYAVTNWR